MKIKALVLAFLVTTGLFSSQPTICEGASMRGVLVTAEVLFPPAACQASVMEQLCSSVTSFLDDEAVKASATLKGCKANCGWKKRKNDLVTAAKKKAKDTCAKGEAPVMCTVFS